CFFDRSLVDGPESGRVSAEAVPLIVEAVGCSPGEVRVESGIRRNESALFEHEIRGQRFRSGRGISRAGVDAELDGFTVVEHRPVSLIKVRPFEVDDCWTPVVECSFEVTLAAQGNHCWSAGNDEGPVI